MNLSLSEDRVAVRDLAHRIFTDLATPDRLREVAAGADRWDRALWSQLAQAGLLGVSLPDADGGSGGAMVEACLLLEEQGSAVAPVPLAATLVLGAMPVAAFGSAEQRARFLPGVIAGTTILTASLPADGGQATISFDGEALTGTVDLVPAARDAAAVVVPARDGDRERLFLVEPGGPGVALDAQPMSSGEVRWRVTLSAAPAEPLGDSGEAAAWLGARAVVAACAQQVGVAERALRMTAEYVTGREQFDRPLGSFQAVQQRLADAFIDVEAMRWTMWQAAWRLDEGLPAGEAVAIAKAWAAEGGQRVLTTAQHLHGGMGVDVEYPLHRYTLWAKDLELWLGSATRHLAGLGASLAAGAPA